MAQPGTASVAQSECWRRELVCWRRTDSSSSFSSSIFSFISCSCCSCTTNHPQAVAPPPLLSNELTLSAAGHCTILQQKERGFRGASRDRVRGVAAEKKKMRGVAAERVVEGSSNRDSVWLRGFVCDLNIQHHLLLLCLSSLCLPHTQSPAALWLCLLPSGCACCPLAVLLPSGCACCPLAVPAALWLCLLPSGCACCPLAVPAALWLCLLPSGCACCPLAVPAALWLCLLPSGCACCPLAAALWLLCLVLIGHSSRVCGLRAL